MDLQLDGKVALVTGAGQGIGRHVAEPLAAEGANVAITQHGRYGVRINTVNPGPVNPGPVNTDQWDTLEKAFARDQGVTLHRAHELAPESIPSGRTWEPAEVAALVTFLASPGASFVNGAHIPVDGAQRKAIMDN